MYTSVITLRSPAVSTANGAVDLLSEERREERVAFLGKGSTVEWDDVLHSLPILDG